VFSSNADDAPIRQFCAGGAHPVKRPDRPFVAPSRDLKQVAREVRAVGGFQLTLTQYRLDFALFSAELVPATDHPLPKWHLHSLGVRDTKSRVALYIEHFSCDSHH
jgi:hypothetical protein